jgi:hypothetical protein
MAIDIQELQQSVPANRLHAELVGKILGYLAEAQRADIEAKFRVGDAIHAMRYSASFDRDALRLLADRIALEQSGILRTARVAERIQRGERELLLSLVNARGLPLTWSHLEALQHVRGKAARLELARIALRDDLSVRELKQRVVQTRGSRRANRASRTGVAQDPSHAR